MAKERRTASAADNVRMGPVALFTLIAVICLAVLAVLAISTANATLTLAQRRADATTQLYQDERAAQAFVAALEERTAAGQALSDQVVQQAAEAALGAQDDAHAQLRVTCGIVGDTVNASFDAGNGRQLDIALLREDDGSLSVARWRMTTVVNEEPAMGNLLGSS